MEAQSCLEQACQYARRGWRVVACHAPCGCTLYSATHCDCHNRDRRCWDAENHPIGKHPRWHADDLPNGKLAATTDEALITAWWKRWPKANVGILAGESGLFVTDWDAKHDGLETLATLQAQHGELPRTPTVRSGGGGLHHYLQRPEGDAPSSTGALGGLDLLSDGEMVMAPPSLHLSKMRYEWLLAPEDCLPAPAPAWLVELARERRAGAHSASGVPENGIIPDGVRDRTLYHLASTMRGKGMVESAIEAALRAVNVAQCVPPMQDWEVEKIARSIGKKPLGGIGPILVNSNGTAHADASEEPKRWEHPWPMPPGEAAYHGLAGDVVRALEPFSEADAAALLVNFLAAFGNCVGAGPHYFANEDRHPARVWAVLVGDSFSGRKGSSWSPVQRLFERADMAWSDGRVAPGGLASGEGLIFHVRDPIKGKGKEGVTGKREGDDPGVQDKRLLVVESEFASALAVMGREGNILSAVLRQAWDRGDLRTLTRNSPLKATGAHIGILGHVTRQDLLRHLTETERANGFANRFLWACVKRSKSLPDGGRIEEDERDRLARAIRSALDTARRVGGMKRDEGARALWHAEYERLSAGEPGLLGAVTARGVPQVLRLSMVYALADGAAVIGADHLAAAMEVWRYCRESAAYVFGDATGDKVADRVLEGLRNQDELTKKEMHMLLGNHTSAAQLDRALGMLESLGRAVMVKRPSGPAGGRPVEAWKIA